MTPPEQKVLKDFWLDWQGKGTDVSPYDVPNKEFVEKALLFGFDAGRQSVFSQATPCGKVDVNDLGSVYKCGSTKGILCDECRGRALGKAERTKEIKKVIGDEVVHLAIINDKKLTSLSANVKTGQINELRDLLSKIEEVVEGGK